MEPSHRGRWALLTTSLALFMVVLDHLVVTTALPSIRLDLGASMQQLEWLVNAYTLSFAVLLLTGAALGDRFGRRRLFAIGLGTFTLASAAAALAPDTGVLIAARTVQGLGGAIVVPLTLTLLSEAFPAQRRGLANVLWYGISVLAVALGPLVVGAVVEGVSWHWIFWLNVPIGLVVILLALTRLEESRGPAGRLDLRGLVLAGGGLLGVVWAVVRGNDEGWTSLEVVAALGAGALLLAAFAAWELRAPAPMLPLHFFRSRPFAVANAVSLLMYFGVFGSIFLLAQFLQTAQGYSALDAGLRTLPWTLMPMLVAPLAGAFSDRVGGRPLMAAGLGLQAVALAWMAGVIDPGVTFLGLLVPFVLAGTGMALVFAPVANVVLASVRPQEAGQASGATNAIREVGGVLGVAVLASIFSSRGGYSSPEAFVDGLRPAVAVGAAVLAAGALLALALPRHRQTSEATSATPGTVLEAGTAG